MVATVQKTRVVGLGDPIIDICCDVLPEFLEAVNAQPGGSTVVAADEMQALLAASSQAAATRLPGGSAANVLKGLASISGGTLRSQFMGMVGRDEAAAFFTEQMQEHGVEPLLLETPSGAPTASCLCMVTPDGQRTMRTCLGAAAELTTAAQLPPAWAHPGPTLLHCEGYILYKPQLAREALAAAKAGGALVSLDLASFEVVAHCRGTLMSLLEQRLVDIVFANEEEAAALAAGQTGQECCNGDGAPQPSLIELAQSLILQYARCCVVSLGARGAVARSSSGEVGSAPAAKVSVVDTIGAGDLFSAGFLYAYLHGCPLSVCCAAGCATGAEAVQVRGTALGDAAWRRLRNTMDELVGAGVAATEGEGDADGLRDIRRPLYAWKSGGMPGGSISSLGSSSMGSSSSQQWLLMDTDAM